MSIQGNRIRKLRKELGITQLELAQACGYKTNTVIALVENGERELSRQKLRKCASILGTTGDYLLGITDNISRPESQDPIDEKYDVLRKEFYNSHNEEQHEEKESFKTIYKYFNRLNEKDKAYVTKLIKRLAE